jgi:hypothetical protein
MLTLKTETEYHSEISVSTLANPTASETAGHQSGSKLHGVCCAITQGVSCCFRTAEARVLFRVKWDLRWTARRLRRVPLSISVSPRKVHIPPNAPHNYRHLSSQKDAAGQRVGDVCSRLVASNITIFKITRFHGMNFVLVLECLSPDIPRAVQIHPSLCLF